MKWLYLLTLHSPPLSFISYHILSVIHLQQIRKIYIWIFEYLINHSLIHQTEGAIQQWINSHSFGIAALRINRFIPVFLLKKLESFFLFFYKALIIFYTSEKMIVNFKLLSYQQRKSTVKTIILMSYKFFKRILLNNIFYISLTVVF